MVLDQRDYQKEGIDAPSCSALGYLGTWARLLLEQALFTDHLIVERTDPRTFGC